MSESHLPPGITPNEHDGSEPSRPARAPSPPPRKWPGTPVVRTAPRPATAEGADQHGRFTGPAPARRLVPLWLVLILCPAFGVGGCMAGLIVGVGVSDVRPGPGPRPVPVSGPLWVTLIYDPESPGLEFARIEEARQGIIAAIKPGTLREFAKDSPKLDDLGLRPFVAKYGTPTLVIQAEGSAKVAAMPCPKSAAEVIEAARQFRGGK